MTKGRVACLFIFILLVIDQVIKLTVKMNMTLGEKIYIFDWFQIYFIENIGMAYGMTFVNKLVLSLFRIVAFSAALWYIHKKAKEGAKWGYIICLSMVAAGAAGNIFDSVFYGLCFTESTPFSVSSLVSLGDGYAPVLMGRVVDMFYFPIIDTNYPDWFPFWGGERFIFFSPIFNFADSCICVAVALILLFYRQELDLDFGHKEQEPHIEEDSTTITS